MQDQLETRAAEKPTNWSDLGKRTLTAVAAAPLALFALWQGGWVWTGLIALVFLGMLDEWWRIARVLHWGTLARLEVAVVYLMPATAALIGLRRADATGLANVLFILLVVWASDIGAYVVGRLVGGPKLAPKISPKKTISGSFGGLVAAIAVGVVADRYTGTASLPHAIFVAVILSIASQLGDLLESWVKRLAHVKDSGWLLPGHGGLLDRLDGLMLAAPVAVLFAPDSHSGLYLWALQP